MDLNFLKSLAKEYVQQQKSEAKIDFYRHLYFNFKHVFLSTFYSQNLQKIAETYTAGKVFWYPKLYEKHFHNLRRKKLNIVEIGIGGYSNPKAGGGSLRMWKTYFPNSQIVGIDIYNKKFHEDRRIKVFEGSQTDEEFLRKVVEEIGGVDIVIDDGSHLNDHVIASFKVLFPMLRQKGLYVIEDTQTSYWPDWGGSENDLNSVNTSMGFLKSLVDGLNYEEFLDNNYIPNYFDKHITAIHFYHNLVFIEKGFNNDGSNILGSRFSNS